MPEDIIADATTQDNTDVSGTTGAEQETATEEATTGESSQTDSQDQETGDDGLMGEGAEDDLGEPPEETEITGDFDVEEGFELPDNTKSELLALGKKHGIKKEAIQDFLNLSFKTQKAQADRDTAASKEANQKTVDGWHAETKKKYGDKYNEVYGKAKKAYNTFFSKEIRGIFKDAGFDSNPLFFDTLVKLGDAISDDAFVKGSAAKTSGDTTYEKLSDVLPQNPKLGKR
jgi:hypothetical protein